jgi:hypothetical protein
MFRILALLLIIALPASATIKSMYGRTANGEPAITGFCSMHKKKVKWRDREIEPILRVCAEQKWEGPTTYMEYLVLVAFLEPFPIPPVDKKEVVLINADSQMGQRVQFGFVDTQVVPGGYLTAHVLMLPEIFARNIAGGVPLDVSVTLAGQSINFELTHDEHQEVSAILALQAIE